MVGDGARAGYEIEIEPEVREWLHGCSLSEYRAAERAADRLAEDGELLPFPLASHLGGSLRELRIGPMRITYWLAPGRRAVLLTVFRKTGNRETDQVERAHRAQKLCEAEHAPAGAHEVYDRDEEQR
ncbi:type II toxin-antitoxin system RelE/ParE family toxin [Kitasatospora sp. NPDC096077]|uniref:type II toxin-antitoxin system RelE/ParE family toxin n=1 Tax=Kitasatospora sp. NPDC096077 TaxID=3155544 RepID=UPI00331DBD88